jgi:hypothetical protein
MIDENALEITRILRTQQQLRSFVDRLLHWLAADLNQAGEQASTFSDARARTLLRAADAADDATLGDFDRLMQVEAAERVAVYDLLADSDLASEEKIPDLAMTAGQDADENATTEAPWLACASAAYAWRGEYPVNQLDPHSPPDLYSPAGQVLQRTAHFLRRQVQRSATDRDKLARRLAQPPTRVPSLDELPESGSTAAPLPPHYRPPIPERYPEMARDTLEIAEDDVPETLAVEVGEPLVIREEDLPDRQRSTDEPVRMPPISINRDQIGGEQHTPPSPMPPTAVVMPNSTVQPRPSFTMALRQMIGQEELTSTKLRVLVQRYPEGPGYYGVQVRVTCKGIKSYVAGTTDQDGRFLCELPVRLESGLTYDVDVTWPRDAGGELERKSITLNADRTIFTLPFYRLSTPPPENT